MQISKSSYKIINANREAFKALPKGLRQQAVLSSMIIENTKKAVDLNCFEKLPGGNQKFLSKFVLLVHDNLLRSGLKADVGESRILKLRGDYKNSPRHLLKYFKRIKAALRDQNPSDAFAKIYHNISRVEIPSIRVDKH